MGQRSGSQLVIDALVQAGVDTVFGYPGGAIMPLYDALLDAPIQHILTRHEQAAIHAADGYARASGRLGVCITTSGPGATNLVTGVATAMMDSVPLLCLTGQVPSKLIGTDAFQETDIFGITTTINKQAYLPRTPDELRDALAEAIYIARTGRPGPVLVDLPKDVLGGTTNRPYVGADAIPGYHPVPRLDERQLTNAHRLLAEARRPVCIVGGGCKLSGAVAVFRRWCAQTRVPVATTLNGIGCVEPGYPGRLGMLGMHGLRRANQAVTDADLILGFGMRFDDRVTGAVDRFAPNARIVHLDIDAAEIGKIIPVDAAVHADLRTSLEAWVALLQDDPIPPAVEWQRQAMSVGDGLSGPAHDAGASVPMTAVLDELFDLIGGSTIVTTDVGQHQMWTAQRIAPDDPSKFITSGGAGTMGYGLPSAVGAQFARPGEPVVAVVGDGGFQMTMAELATIRRCNLPVKILVMDNKYLGMVRQWQELFFDRRYSAVDLSDNPDFAAIARVYGLEAMTLSRAESIRAELERWWGCEGPALLHVLCHMEKNVFPMVPAGAGLGEMVEAER